MAMKIIILIVTNVALVYCHPKCCSGENLALSSRLCSDGTTSFMDHCNATIFLEANDNSTNFIIDSHNNLIMDYDYEDIFPEKDFCLTTLKEDNKAVYFICVNESSSLSVDTMAFMKLTLQLVSAVFIIVTIAIYITIPPLLDIQGINIIHSISGLAFGFIFLAILNFSVDSFNPIECHLLAYLLYTSFMYSFFWLNIISFHIWREAVSPKILAKFKSWKLIYYCYGLGGPLLLLIFLASVHHADSPNLKHIHPGIGEVTCWFKTSRETAMYFYGPISLLLLLNVVFFAWTIYVLWNEATTFPNEKSLKYRVRLYVKLFFIMGLTWIFESIQGFIKNKQSWVWEILDVINALEGVIIFFILVVFRKKVIRHLANKKMFANCKCSQMWQQIGDSECEEIEEAGIQLKTPNSTDKEMAMLN